MLTRKKNEYENCTALRCYHLVGERNCTALRCYHLGGEQFAQFCAIITLNGENVTFLNMPGITAGDCNVLDSG